MMGVLPAHYAELIEERRRAGDDGLREFLAIFEDRIVRLLLQAHRRNRFWLRFAWNAGIRADDSRVGATAFERMILSLVGTAGGNLRLRAGLPAAAQVHYGGLLAQHPLNADSLSSVVADFFGVECAINQMQGNWVDIPPAALSRLGSSRGASLGVDLIAGDRYFDPALGIRMELGPMRLGRFQSLLPGTEGAGALEDFARVALGGSMQFDYSLVLVKEEVPDARLTHEEDAAQRLGWSFWLFAGDEPSDAECGPLHGRRIDQPTHSRT